MNVGLVLRLLILLLLLLLLCDCETLRFLLLFFDLKITLFRNHCDTLGADKWHTSEGNKHPLKTCQRNGIWKLANENASKIFLVVVLFSLIVIL